MFSVQKYQLEHLAESFKCASIHQIQINWAKYFCKEKY